MPKSLTRIAAIVLGASLALTGAACASETTNSENPAQTLPVTEAPSEALQIHDAWVKAAESGMSAGFGTLINNSGEDVNVVSATTAASPMVELHETVENAEGQMVMREVEGGFVVAAHSEYVLEPGGNHLMLMNLNGALLAGNSVEFTLELADGTVITFEAPIKDYAGANEQYEHGHDNHESHDH